MLCCRVFSLSSKLYLSDSARCAICELNKIPNRFFSALWKGCCGCGIEEKCNRYVMGVVKPGTIPSISRESAENPVEFGIFVVVVVVLEAPMIKTNFNFTGAFTLYFAK